MALVFTNLCIINRHCHPDLESRVREAVEYFGCGENPWPLAAGAKIALKV